MGFWANRQLPPYWIQLTGRISRFTKSVTLPDHLHVLNVITPLLQRGLL